MQRSLLTSRSDEYIVTRCAEDFLGEACIEPVLVRYFFLFVTGFEGWEVSLSPHLSE